MKEFLCYKKYTNMDQKHYFGSTIIEIFKYNFVLFFGYEIMIMGK